jgi:hypothetical protein
MAGGIPETRTLYEILPSKSASSGRESARIVNLLLFHDARRNGCTDQEIEEHRKAAAESKTLFAQLAEKTCALDHAPLRVAHCIRDLAYGDEGQAATLKKMVQSDDSEYRDIFERCYWRPTEEDRKREANNSIGRTGNSTIVHMIDCALQMNRRQAVNAISGVACLSLFALFQPFAQSLIYASLPSGAGCLEGF